MRKRLEEADREEKTFGKLYCDFVVNDCNQRKSFSPKQEMSAMIVPNFSRGAIMVEASYI